MCTNMDSSIKPSKINIYYPIKRRIFSQRKRYQIIWSSLFINYCTFLHCMSKTHWKFERKKCKSLPSQNIDKNLNTHTHIEQKKNSSNYWADKHKSKITYFYPLPHLWEKYLAAETKALHTTRHIMRCNYHETP